MVERERKRDRESTKVVEGERESNKVVKRERKRARERELKW